MPSAARQFCTVLGGPNGSGKSTIYRYLQPQGTFINADVEARAINPVSPETVSLAAGRRVLKRLDRAVEAREDFVYETTLSSHQSLALMARCRTERYEVSLVFVALQSVDLHLRRVAERVAAGGHDIPEHVIRRRYDSAFARLPEAIRAADRVLLFDNSALEPAMRMSIEFGEITANNLDETSALNVRLAQAVGMALRVSTEAVLRATR